MKKLIILSLLLLTACKGEAPDNLGIRAAKLADCPASPNCVVSRKNAPDEAHYIEPMKVMGNLEESRLKIVKILNQDSQFKIIVNDPVYLYAEYTSSVFGFVDDIEFYFSPENIIHLRSASRTGHSDMGANRKRIEMIRFKYHQHDY